MGTLDSHDSVRVSQGFDNRPPENRLPVEPAVDAVLDTGEVVLFSDHTPHASHPNLSGRDRWALIPTWRPVGGAEVATIWATPVPVRAPFRQGR